MLKLAVVMVGLPARGKTFIAQKIARYLNWLGIVTQVFNVGNYRRKMAGVSQPHEFFDTHNAEGLLQRHHAAKEALEDMLRWLESGDVAIYDATNSVKQRREMIATRCKEAGVEVLFVEIICKDDKIVMSNIREVKISSPDYANVDPETAASDFRARIAHYENVYETMTEESYAYVQLIDVGIQYIMNRVKGYWQSRIVYFCMNLHITPRAIFFCRHGESLFNVDGKIGGDSDLSPNGLKFAQLIPNIIAEQIGTQPLTVWTSTMKRTIQTSQNLQYPKLQWKALDEIYAGVCDGMTYEEIEKRYPEDFQERDGDKFNYRYQGGESYRDLVIRLEPIIMELERQTNILIVGHQAVLRCLYSYFLNIPHDKLPYIKVPLHTLIKFTPKAYHCTQQTFILDIDAVDTHRGKSINLN